MQIEKESVLETNTTILKVFVKILVYYLIIWYINQFKILTLLYTILNFKSYNWYSVVTKNNNQNNVYNA